MPLETLSAVILMVPVGAMDVRWLFLIPVCHIFSWSTSGSLRMNGRFMYSLRCHLGKTPFSTAKSAEVS